jgi:putative chitinase
MVVVMTFNKTTFFDSVRANLFGGSLAQSQVDGINFILREWRRRYDFGGDHRHLSYMFATSHLETAYTHLPIKEYGSQSYLQGQEYWPYIGRGFVMLTWEENYAKASDITGEDLVAYPDDAMQPDIAAVIMFSGMEEGWFTGKALSDYFSDTVDDPVNARRIINGTDRAEEIAGFYFKFWDAIQAGLEG